MKSNVLETTKKYIPNITKPLKIFIFEPSFKFILCKKKYPLFLCTILNLKDTSKLHIASDLAMFGMWFFVDLTTFDLANFYKGILAIFKVMNLITLKDILSSKKWNHMCWKRPKSTHQKSLNHPKYSFLNHLWTS